MKNLFFNYDSYSLHTDWSLMYTFIFFSSNIFIENLSSSQPFYKASDLLLKWSKKGLMKVIVNI